MPNPRNRQHHRTEGARVDPGTGEGPIEIVAERLTRERNQEQNRSDSNQDRPRATHPATPFLAWLDLIQPEGEIQQRAEQQIDVRRSIEHPRQVGDAGQVAEPAIHVLARQEKGHDAGQPDPEVHSPHDFAM